MHCIVEKSLFQSDTLGTAEVGIFPMMLVFLNNYLILMISNNSNDSNCVSTNNN